MMMTKLLNSENIAFFLLLYLLDCSAVIEDSIGRGDMVASTVRRMER